MPSDVVLRGSRAACGCCHHEEILSEAGKFVKNNIPNKNNHFYDAYYERKDYIKKCVILLTLFLLGNILVRNNSIWEEYDNGVQ